MYLPTAGVGSFGVAPVVWRLDTYYKPWYFTGRVVIWGPLHSTRSRALSAAESMAAKYTTSLAYNA